MILAWLPKVHEVGTVINLFNRAYRLVRETGNGLEHLPGGRGIRQVEIEVYSENVLTVDELAFINQGLHNMDWKAELAKFLQACTELIKKVTLTVEEDAKQRKAMRK